MQCSELHRRWVDARYSSAGLDAEATAHVAGCEACQAYIANAERLDALMAEDRDEEPRPGFDTRFFARLAEAKSVRRRFLDWRWLLPTGAAATAAAGLFLWMTSAGQAPPMASDLELAMNLEMLQAYEVVRDLEQVETYERFADLDPEVVERLLRETEAQP
jgi:hypothetical protein